MGARGCAPATPHTGSGVARHTGSGYRAGAHAGTRYGRDAAGRALRDTADHTGASLRAGAGTEVGAEVPRARAPKIMLKFYTYRRVGCTYTRVVVYDWDIQFAQTHLTLRYATSSPGVQPWGLGETVQARVIVGPALRVRSGFAQGCLLSVVG